MVNNPPCKLGVTHTLAADAADRPKEWLQNRQ